MLAHTGPGQGASAPPEPPAPRREPEATDQPLDELLACLILLARAHGATLTRDAALAGLPAEQGRLSPSLFERAARRAGLSSRTVRQPISMLKTELFPVVLLLADDRACLLLERSADGKTLTIVQPELGESPVQVAASELEADYLDRAIYARPRQRFDARSPQVKAGTHGHWFWGVIAENRKLYRDVLLAAFMSNLFALGLPMFTMAVYDRVVPNQAYDTLWVLASGLTILLLGDLLLRAMRSRFVDLASARADLKLSTYIMERVLGTRMEQRPVSVGSFAANLRSFESVRDFIGSATVLSFIDLPFSLIFFIAISWVAFPMLLPLAVGALLVLVFALAVQHRMHELAETTYRAGAQRNATLVEGLVGFETIKSLAAESRFQLKWEKSAALLARVNTQLRFLTSLTSSTSSVIQQAVTMSIIIVGAYLIGDRQLTLGGLIACSMLSSRAMGPIGQAASLLVQYHTASTALTSLNEVMNREVERPDDAGFVARGTLDGAIEFRDVSFAYPGQQTPLLRNLSFKVAPGEKVALLGRIGSGKTTIEKLVLGLYRPSSGAVLIDGIDQRQLDPAELRRHIGYVPQDVMLFYGTMRENITLGAPLAEDDAVLRAAEVAGISAMVDAHPKGFDMPVGERGDSLSGGQRQGVAIARAVINDPPIMLLDEPSASMDNSSEEDLKRRLGAFIAHKTLLLITHRTSLLELVDRIIIIDAGKIVADGPRAQVIAALRQGRIGKAS
ncbi:MAG: type I secretion system permease/ATPase [Quisquiliibacterium sp.]